MAWCKSAEWNLGGLETAEPSSSKLSTTGIRKNVQLRPPCNRDILATLWICWHSEQYRLLPLASMESSQVEWQVTEHFADRSSGFAAYRLTQNSLPFLSFRSFFDARLLLLKFVRNGNGLRHRCRLFSTGCVEPFYFAPMLTSKGHLTDNWLSHWALDVEGLFYHIPLSFHRQR